MLAILNADSHLNTSPIRKSTDPKWATSSSAQCAFAKYIHSAQNGSERRTHPSPLDKQTCKVVRAQHIIRCSKLRCLRKKDRALVALSLSCVPFFRPAEWCTSKKVGTVFSITGLWKLHSPCSNQIQMPIVMDSCARKAPGPNSAPIQIRIYMSSPLDQCTFSP